jgi:hypothetical protein
MGCINSKGDKATQDQINNDEPDSTTNNFWRQPPQSLPTHKRLQRHLLRKQKNGLPRKEDTPRRLYSRPITEEDLAPKGANGARRARSTSVDTSGDMGWLFEEHGNVVIKGNLFKFEPIRQSKEIDDNVQ